MTSFSFIAKISSNMLLSKNDSILIDIVVYANKKYMKCNSKTPRVQNKGAAKNLKKARMKKLKSKWATKAGVVLVQMRINF